MKGNVWKSYLVVQVLRVAQVTHLFLEDLVFHELEKTTWQLAAGAVIQTEPFSLQQ